jgi:hypothetical protein
VEVVSVRFAKTFGEGVWTSPRDDRRRDWTVTELVIRYLAQHQAAPATIARA